MGSSLTLENKTKSNVVFVLEPEPQRDESGNLVTGKTRIETLKPDSIELVPSGNYTVKINQPGRSDVVKITDQNRLLIWNDVGAVKA